MKPDVKSDVGKGLPAVLTIAGDGLFVLVTETAGSVAGEELAVSRTTEVRCTSGDAVVSLVEV